jgi:hypothetical protein
MDTAGDAVGSVNSASYDYVEPANLEGKVKDEASVAGAVGRDSQETLETIDSALAPETEDTAAVVLEAVEVGAVEESGVDTGNTGGQQVSPDDTQKPELEEPNDKPDNTGSSGGSGSGSLLGDLPPPPMSSMAMTPNLRPPHPVFDSSISDELDDLYDFDGSTPAAPTGPPPTTATPASNVVPTSQLKGAEAAAEIAKSYPPIKATPPTPPNPVIPWVQHCNTFSEKLFGGVDFSTMVGALGDANGPSPTIPKEVFDTVIADLDYSAIVHESAPYSHSPDSSNNDNNNNNNNIKSELTDEGLKHYHLAVFDRLNEYLADLHAVRHDSNKQSSKMVSLGKRMLAKTLPLKESALKEYLTRVVTEIDSSVSSLGPVPTGSVGNGKDGETPQRSVTAVGKDPAAAVDGAIAEGLQTFIQAELRSTSEDVAELILQQCIAQVAKGLK